ncbi:MAG TPA: HDOD domain-containing protein [bacterium]|nr:HDOD domain-containing protein [bacterium]
MNILEQLKDIVELPTIPTTLVRVLRVVQSEDTDAKDLAKVVYVDQALAAKILKVANSALYSLPRKVNDIERAVALLGFNEVRDLSLSISVFDSLYLPTGGAYWNRAKFWEHCFVVAYLTRELARNMGLEGGNAFSAGLLHDLGKLIQDRYFPIVFRQIIERVDAEQLRFIDIETALFGTDHGVIGGYLLGLWNLPDELVAGVSNHHHPVEESEKIATAVYCANELAHIGGFSVLPSEPDSVLEEFYASPITVALKEAGRLPSESILANSLVKLEENAEELSAQAAMLL